MTKYRFAATVRFPLALLLLTVAFPVTAEHPANPKTVVDYFLIAPNKYLEVDEHYESGAPVEDRKRVVKYSHVDLRNDYMSVNQDSGPSIAMALFRSKGRVLIAVSAQEYDTFPSEYEFYLLRYEDGVWHDVTKQMLPSRFNKFHNYVLPRYGTTIKVKNAKEKTLYTLRWEAGKFVKERTSH